MILIILFCQTFDQAKLYRNHCYIKVDIFGKFVNQPWNEIYKKEIFSFQTKNTTWTKAFKIKCTYINYPQSCLENMKSWNENIKTNRLMRQKKSCYNHIMRSLVHEKLCSSCTWNKNFHIRNSNYNELKVSSAISLLLAHKLAFDVLWISFLIWRKIVSLSIYIYIYIYIYIHIVLSIFMFWWNPESFKTKPKVKLLIIFSES